jgi:branched-chain amino acid transport system substrate-binding protein
MVSPSTTGDCLTVAQRPCPSPTASDLRPTKSNNFFRISPRDPEQGTAVAYYAAARLGLKRVAAFNKLGGQGELYIQKFKDEFRRLGGALVYEEELPDQLDDFTGFLSHARNLGVDAIFAVGTVDQHTCKAAAQLAALLPGAVFLGTDNVTFQPGCIDDMGVSPPQVFASIGAVDPGTSNAPAVKNAVAAYLKVHAFRFDSSGYTPYVFAAYDCARILIEAIRRAIRSNGGKFPSRAQVVAALTQPPDFLGLTGMYYFDNNGDAINPMMSVYKVEAGRWKFVEVLNLGSA